MMDKDIKKRISDFKLKKLDEICRTYYVDPCGCYVVDPCACHVTCCCCS